MMGPSQNSNSKPKPFLLPPYRCYKCLKVYSKFDVYRRHKRRHNKGVFHTGYNQRKSVVDNEDEDEVFKCEQCDLQFLSKFGLAGHQACHSVSAMLGSPRYIGNAVGTRLGSPRYIDRAVSPMLGSPRYMVQLSNKISQVTQTPSPVHYNCRYCPKTFVKLFVKEAHERFHFRQSFSRSYKCRYCHQSFSSKDVCSVHQSTHLEGSLFQCKACAFTSVSQKKLLSHQRKHHGKKFIKCMRCEVKFESKKKLTKHVRKVHRIKKSHKRKLFDEGIEKERQSEVCESEVTDCNLAPENEELQEDELQEKQDESFNQETSSKFTFPNVQWKCLDGQTLYGCVFCGKAFTKETDLDTHKKTHGELSEVNHGNGKDSGSEKSDSKDAMLTSIRSPLQKSNHCRNSLSPTSKSHKQQHVYNELVDVKDGVTDSVTNRFCENDVLVQDKVSSKKTCAKRKRSEITDSETDSADLGNKNLSSVSVSEMSDLGSKNISPMSVSELGSKNISPMSVSELGSKNISPMSVSEMSDLGNKNPSAIPVSKMSDLRSKNLSFLCDLCGETFCDENELNLHKKTHLKQPKLTKNYTQSSPSNAAAKIPSTFAKEIPFITENEIPPSADEEIPFSSVSKILFSTGNNILCNDGEDTVASVITEGPQQVNNLSGSDIDKDAACSIIKSPSLKCYLCEKTFSSKAALNSHKNTHVSWDEISEALEHNQSSTCHLCGKTYASSATLAMHLRTHVKRPKSNRIKTNMERKSLENCCSEIKSEDSGFKSTPVVSVHTHVKGKEKSNYRDVLDGESFERKSCEQMCSTSTKSSRTIAKVSLSDITNTSLSNSVTLNQSDNEDHDGISLKCSQCDAVFFSQTTLECHTRIRKEQSTPYRGTTESHNVKRETDNESRNQCRNLRNESCDELNRSKRRVNRKASVPCKKCKLSFKTTAAFENHVLQKSNGTMCKQYKCKTCEKCYKWYSQLEIHMCMGRLRSFVCGMCGQSLDGEGKLERHDCTTPKPVQNFNGHKCDECGKVYNRKGDLTRHKLVHTGQKPFICEHCGLRFARNSYLKRHANIHTWKKSYKCQYCDQKFPTLDSKAYHETKHKPITNRYVCEQCGKSFPFTTSLTYHKQKVHASTKKFKCRFCPKDFAQKGDLNIHERIHTGEKPYRCPHSDCKRGFPSKTHLNRHERRIHSPGGSEKPFQCNDCPNRYCHKRYLEQHVKAKHTKSKFKLVVKMASQECLSSAASNSSSDSDSDLPSDLESVSSESSSSSDGESS